MDRAIQFVVQTAGWIMIFCIASPQSGWATAGLIVGVILTDITLVD